MGNKSYVKPTLFRVNLFPRQTVGVRGCKDPDVQATTVNAEEYATCADYAGICEDSFGS
jgi:hypothetical protein